MRRFILTLGSLIFVLFVCGTLSYSQSDRATISGTVSDPAGAVLPGATVTIKNDATGVISTAQTNGEGIYTVISLPVGEYTLQVKHGGFRTYVRSGISPLAGQVVTVNVQMQIGSASQTITVTGGAPLLQTQTATEAMTIESKAILELPLNANGGRNALNLLLATAPNVGAGYSIANIETQNWVSIAGGETFSNTMYIDGTSATAGNQGMAMTPGQDAIREMQLQTNITNAALAGSGGGAILYVLKSGTNHVHGTAFEYLQNQALNANSWENNYYQSQCAPGDAACTSEYSRSFDRFNDFGGSLGGPLWKNHTFLFGDYEHYTQSDGQLQPDGMTIPTKQLLSGDLSPLLTEGTHTGTIDQANGQPWINPCTGNPYQYGQVFDPQTQKTVVVNGVATTCATPFQGNIIPPGRLSAVSQKIAAAYEQYYTPLMDNQNLQGGNFPANASDTPSLTKTMFDIKLDHNFSENHHISASLDWERDNEQNIGGPFYYNSGPFRSTWGYSDPDNMMARVIDNYAFTPSLMNTASFAWDYTNAQQQPVNTIDPTTYGFTTGVGVFPEIEFGNAVNGINFSWIGADWGLYWKNDSFNYADTLTWLKGRHDMQFGVQWIAQQLNAANYTKNEQYYSFASDTGGPTDPGLTPYVGSGLAAFLLGDVNASQLYLRNNYYVRQKTMAAFAQDNFKATPKLTLDMGLRWDLTLPSHQPNGNWENWNVYGTNPNWAPSMGAWEFSQNGGTTFETHIPLYQFGPHIGIDRQLTNNLVVRAAYALDYVPLGQLTSGAADYYPENQDPNAIGTNLVQTTVAGGTAFNWDSGYPGVTAAGPKNDTNTLFGDGDGGEMIYINPDMLKLGRVNTFYAGFQWELARNVLLDTRYLGTFGGGLHDYGRGYNVSYGNDGQYSDSPETWPMYNALLQTGNTTTEISNAGDAASLTSELNAAGYSVTVPYPYPGFSGPAYAAIASFPQLATLGYRAELAGDPTLDGESHYNALVAELKVRNAHGLYVDWSYTVSMATSDLSSVGWGGGLSNFSNIWGSTMQDPNDLQQWPVSNDQRQLAKGYITYDLPFGANHRWLNQSRPLSYFVGGWTIGYYGAYGSGLPMGPVLAPSTLPYYYDSIQRAFFANGASADHMQNMHHGNKVDLADPTDPSNRDFCSCAFNSNSATYTGATGDATPFGNSPYYYSHWRWNSQPAMENISILKHFPVGGEGRNFELRAALFNAFNRHYLSAPNESINSDTFGDVTSVATAPRVIQVGARFRF